MHTTTTTTTISARSRFAPGDTILRNDDGFERTIESITYNKTFNAWVYNFTSHLSPHRIDVIDGHCSLKPVAKFKIGDVLADKDDGYQRTITDITIDHCGLSRYTFFDGCDSVNFGVKYIEGAYKLAPLHSYRVNYSYLEHRLGYVQAHSEGAARKMVENGECEDSTFVVGGDPHVTAIHDDGVV